MQLDMFGATDESATRDAAPPIMSAAGAWLSPEAIAFNAALKRGSLNEAIGVLNRLKASVVAQVLLTSGFTIGPSNTRANLIAFVQTDILAAVRLRMTGYELRATQIAAPGESDIHVATGSPEKMPVTVDSMSKLERGIVRVVDGAGREYQVFSARSSYVEVHPIDADGKPEIFDGNSVFFHLDPKTADAYPGRRHDAIFWIDSLAVAKPVEVAQNVLMHDSPTSGATKEIEDDGRIEQSESVLPGNGNQNRIDGGNGHIDRESLEDGLAGSGESAADRRQLSGILGNASGQGEGSLGERAEFAAPVAPGNIADVRNPRIATGNRDTELDVTSIRKWSKKELDVLFVTDMTDEQLLQAKGIYLEGSRASAIARQFVKRAKIARIEFAPAVVESAVVAPAWHTTIPAAGLPMLESESQGTGYREVGPRIAKDAIAAITQVQKLGGAEMHAYILPASGDMHGRVRLLPGDQETPAGWRLLAGEVYRAGAMSDAQMLSRLISDLASAPILGQKLVTTVTSDINNNSRFISLNSILTPAGSIKSGSLDRLDTNAWFHQGDINHIQFAAKVTVLGQAPSAKAIAAWDDIVRARADGWRLTNYRAGKLGTVWLLEKDDNVLTNAGVRMDGQAIVPATVPTIDPLLNVASSPAVAAPTIVEIASNGGIEGVNLPASAPVLSTASTAPGVDYVLTDDDRIGIGSLAEKFQDNLRAIQVLRVLDVEKRNAAGDELRSLARYVGWGGLKGVFDPQNKQWAKQHIALRSLLSDAEWAAAKRSQLNAHYTAPVVVKTMYSAVSRLGFKHGRFLEPSVGVGNFFGLMPESMREKSTLHGVELDVLTSRIVAALYPNAKIAKGTGFQQYNTPAGFFDIVAGNPPFGSEPVSDDRGSAYSGWSIHNYFFAKSIEMLRPGGIMPMVVSHNFLDKLDPHVRQWIARRAELISGVRLPNTAFKENANTEVVTDILIFRRLDNENTLGKDEIPDWLDTTDVSIENPKTGENESIAINNYFINNPQNVLGSNSTSSSMYRANEYTVLPNGDLAEQLAGWVGALPEGIYVPLERTTVELSLSAVDVPEFVKEGSFFIQHEVDSGKSPAPGAGFDGLVDGKAVYQRLPDQLGERRAVRWEPSNQRALERMVGMVGIREALREQMRLERSMEASDVQIEAGRRDLNRVYNKFQEKNGFLNDQINRRLFLDDTESSLIQALEFDYEKAITASKADEYGIDPRPARSVKADIFSRRVLFPPVEVEIVENAKDALLHSLNITGRVDMAYMENAYGQDKETIVAELGDLLFSDPVHGFVTADEYMSGDVKTKLAEVMKAASENPALSRNVEALKKIIPVDKLPSEIHASIGAGWIPSKIFSEFAKNISGSDAKFTYLASTGQWLNQSSSPPDYVKNSTEFGTVKMSAMDILIKTMNSRGLEVKKLVTVDGKERYVTDEEATEAVRERGDKMRAHWDSWLWSNGDRADQLTAIYNDKFNRIVERSYDGSHLTFPGMNPMVKLLTHQKNGVWRGLQDRGMLLDQVVGAGKTFEIVAMAMEMRRLGITKKPLIAVPNHLTLQWRSEFYRLYPGANVLAATPQDFEKENRERFFSKIVTGNWDAVIVGHSSLKKIAVPVEAEMKIIKEQFDDIAAAIEDMKRDRGDRNIIRDMEKVKANLESKFTKLKENGGKKDNVVDFGDLGVDALFIDEMHEFKNLTFTTQMNRVSGLGNPAGSGKAFDLFVKIRWLQETFGDKAPLITATGTPISNSLAEMFTMQRYMQYGALKANGLHVFDAWAKQYGDVQNVYEVAPSGSGYRLSQRFAKFKNLPSLMGAYRSFADVITLDDLKAQETAIGKTFPVPKLVGGRPQNVVANRSPLQEKFFGIPEIVRKDDGEIKFEVNLDIPFSIEQREDGKFGMKQDLGGYFAASKGYDTREEAEYMTALAATTPVMKVDPKSIVGQFENLRELTRSTKGKINALSLTGLANKAGLDYRLINPSAVDYPGSKVNIAVRNILMTAKKWESVKGVQLIFCDLSVPLSAKSKMASKEKRVYVRDEQGRITNKKGTLHSVKDYEGLPYYLVAVGKGASKTFSIYDPVGGSVMKEGLDSKQAAHLFVSNFVTQEGGQERWLDQREQARTIDADEIDEFKSEHSIDADGDAADLEISMQDIEGSTSVAGFSIYDDMKEKLIANGIPAAQIEFIHDHDTPQAKDLLFKRGNAGDVRFLFGSTPKMGAGTNVQKRLVALHHIDAPWRPSDLEQREGRIIRRGNELYESDPDGFEVEVNRYATAQTYDTRRWQLLEHKAAGVEQLRNYDGANEIDDVTTEASNSADMKAAASGNPLILKETQLSNEVKKLRMLERAHRDSEYTIRSRMNSFKKSAEVSGPKSVLNLTKLQAQRDAAVVLGKFEGRTLTDKESIMVVVDKMSQAIMSNDITKTLIYRGLQFEFNKSLFSEEFVMISPDDDRYGMEKMSPSGVLIRMENWCNDIERKITNCERNIVKDAEEARKLAPMVGKPFARSEDLMASIAEHGKVQRALMKANSMAAVKPKEMAAFQLAVEGQKRILRGMGLGRAVGELEKEGEVDNVAVATAAVEHEAGPAPGAGFDGLGKGDGNSIGGAVLSLVDGPTIVDKNFFYVSGMLGMKADGTFTLEKRHWAMFSREGVLSMQDSNQKPAGATQRGVFIGTKSSNRLVIAKPVTPQVPVKNMEEYIKVAADSVAELRKTDVYRVLVESNRAEHRQAIASYIKSNRPDLVAEVNDVLDEVRVSLANVPVSNDQERKLNASDSPKEDEQLLRALQLLEQTAEIAQAVGVPEDQIIVPVASGQLRLDVDHIKARMVDSLPMEVPAGAIVMNAPRPLLGSQTMDGEFVAGRFYALILPDDPMAERFIEENRKLDARLLVIVPEDTRMELAMHKSGRRDQYRALDARVRNEWLSSNMSKYQDMPFAELSKSICEAMGVVREGGFSGTVTDVANGVVTQRINREGGVVRHDASKLSTLVQIGDVLDVQYKDGLGAVLASGKAMAVGR